VPRSEQSNIRSKRDWGAIVRGFVKSSRQYYVSALLCSGPQCAKIAQSHSHLRKRQGRNQTSKELDVILTTTPNIEGRPISEYLGIVTGEAILGANLFNDFFAGIRDIVGGRSAAYEREMARARKIAYEDIKGQAEELGANAVVGIDIDYEVIGANSSMLMVSINGTAVSLL
jgi:uncharacterized protein YbjQ (UPF0145 family)